MKWHARWLDMVPDLCHLTGVIAIGIGLCMLVPAGYVWVYAGFAMIWSAHFMAGGMAEE